MEIMDITVNSAYDLFLNDRMIFGTAKTISYYEENLKRFMKFLSEHICKELNEIYMSEIPKTILKEYVLYLRKKPKNQGHPYHESKGKIKNTTLNTYVRAVKVFFRWSYEEEYYPHLLKIKLPKPDPEVIVPLYDYEVKQIDALFSERTEQGLRNLSMIHLMLDCALRLNEVVQLKIENLDFTKSLITLSTAKGNSFRPLPMPSKVKSYLYKYLILYRSFNNNCNPSDFVFIKIKTREPINDNVIKQLFTRIKKRTGIQRAHPHLLRHTFATSYIMGGGNLEFLRLLMGHTDYSITRNYLHLANQYTILKADIYKLDSIFFRTAY